MLAKIYDITSLSPLAKHMREGMTWPLQSISVWDVSSVLPVLAVNSIMHVVFFFSIAFSLQLGFSLKICFFKKNKKQKTFSFSLMKDNLLLLLIDYFSERKYFSEIIKHGVQIFILHLIVRWLRNV